MNGILLVNKPQGMTSHDVVNKVRKLTNEKKVGHTGTLDPNASGLLVLCIGEATKLIPYLDESNKVYEGTFKFGIETDTDDVEGEILNQKPVDNLKLEDLQKVLLSYLGVIEQVPPKYSAKKVNGKKLYQYARKNEDVEIKPAKVEIYDIDILNSDKFPEEVILKIDCSKGTYIRSLARDIGHDLNNYANLKTLKRFKTNNYNVQDSFTLEELEGGNIEEKLLPMSTAVGFLKPITVKDEAKRFLLNGNRLLNHNITQNIYDYKTGETVALFNNNDLLGIGVINSQSDKKVIQPKRIFKNG